MNQSETLSSLFKKKLTIKNTLNIIESAKALLNNKESDKTQLYTFLKES